MKHLLFSIALTIFLVACCPKRQPCYLFTMTDTEWNMLGFDTINIAITPIEKNTTLTHICVFQDETGKKDTLKQELTIYEMHILCEYGRCCPNCPNWVPNCVIEDSIINNAFIFACQPSDIDISFDSMGYGFEAFPDTLTNFSFQNIIYPQAFRFQADTNHFLPNKVYLKTLYFAPRKGLLKLEFTQNHFWERIN